MTKRELDLKSAYKIIDIVNEYFGVKCNVKSRKIPVIIPRQISQYFIKKNLKLPYQVIATMFNLKDHATIMSSCKKIDWDSVNSPEISLQVQEISYILRSNRSLQNYRSSTKKRKQIREITDLLDNNSMFELKDINRYLLAKYTKI